MPELILVLVIVVLVFGVGRVGKLGAEAGQAIREFRRGLGAASAPEPGPAAAEPVDQPEPTEPAA